MDKSSNRFLPDPLIGSLVGLCPVVFVTANFGAGLIVAFGILFSIGGIALFLPALRSLFPERLRPPLAFGLSASIVAIYGLLASFYAPALASLAGIFIPLTLVNCIVLLVLRNGVRGEGAGGAPLLVMSLRYFAAVVFLAALREVLGAGSLTLPLPGDAERTIAVFPVAPLAIMASPAGGFMLLGLLAALYRLVERRLFSRRIP